MNYNQLGKSELLVSEIGFGCMSLKGTEAENISLIHAAIDSGINFFDTADLYDKGENEKTIGKAINGSRSKIILATKVGNQWRPDGSGWDWNASKEYILQAIDKSLQRLQTDYIDLYQLHGGTIDDPIDETVEAFELLKQQGKIRYYGISSIRPNVIREYVKRSSVSSVMMQYSLLDRRPEEECLQLLKQKGIGVLARGSIAQGLLIDKQPKEYLGRSAREVEKAAIAIKKLSDNHRTPAQTAIRFVLQHSSITSVIAGMRNREQLAEAVKTSLSTPINEEELIQLQSSVEINYYTDHR